jgi:multiple sugar transport system permease protein
MGAVAPVLAVIALVGLSPFLSAIWNSFFHDIYGQRSFAGLENFRYITRDAGFGFSLNITVLWATLISLLSLSLGFLLALRLTDRRRTSGLLFRMLLIPWGIPVYIAVPLWRAFLHGNGGESVISRLTGVTVNLMVSPAAGFLGALAVSLWMSVPLTAFVLAAHMRQVPRQVIEAASIDGASRGQMALHIYLPAIRESLLALGLRNFIGAFKEFTLIFLLTAGGPPLVQGITERHIIGATTTLGVFLYEIYQGTGDWGVSSAYAVLMSLVVLFCMIVWALVRRGSITRRWLRAIVLLAALAQVPGGNIVLWVVAALYAGAALHPRLARWTVIAHSVYMIFRVATVGFLAGFHPGLLVGLLAVIIINRGVRGGPEQPAWKRQPPRFGRRSRARAPGSWRAPGRLLGGAVTGTSVGLSFSFVVATVVILYMLFWMSLSRVSAVYVDSLLPARATGANYVRLFEGERILVNFRNTLVIAGVTALLLPLTVFPAAVWLQRRGRRAVLLFLGGIQMLELAGGMHSLIPLYRVFLALGIVDTFLPLILVYLYHALPFSLFVLTAYLSSIPASFRDIATLEGMSLGGYAFRILLPLSLPALLTTVMSAFIGAWNGFMPALLFLNSERLYPISMKLYGWVGSLASGTPVWNLFAAASVVNMLLVGVLLARFRNPMRMSPIADSPE